MVQHRLAAFPARELGAVLVRLYYALPVLLFERRPQAPSLFSLVTTQAVALAVQAFECPLFF
jgi:hypothetical protein